MIKTLLSLCAVCGALLFISACQNPPQKKSDDFNTKTHRTYNPATGTFEQSPPFGKQGDKSDTQ